MLPQNLNLLNTGFCDNILSIGLILIKKYFIFLTITINEWVKKEIDIF
jgi:hypothetical protein